MIKDDACRLHLAYAATRTCARRTPSSPTPPTIAPSSLRPPPTSPTTTSLILKKDLGQDIQESDHAPGACGECTSQRRCRPTWVYAWSTAHAARHPVELTQYPSRRS